MHCATRCAALVLLTAALATGAAAHGAFIATSMQRQKPAIAARASPGACQAPMPRLHVKPTYPPEKDRGVPANASTAQARVGMRAQALQQLQAVEREQRAISRSVQRLQSTLEDLLQTMENSDDVAFLERQTCATVVYNQHLNRVREPQLLRTGLRRIATTYF